MKPDEPSTAGTAGDISPITGTVSNLPDTVKDGQQPAVETKKQRKAEPTFEKLTNYSRVVPAQLPHIVFPAEGRFQPVRPVSNRAPKTPKGKSTAASSARTPSPPASGVTSERYVGSGGILILIDQIPDEPIEYIEPELPPPVEPITSAATPGATAQGSAAATMSQGPHIDLDENEPEADPPESFEVCLFRLALASAVTNPLSLSTPLMISLSLINALFVLILGPNLQYIPYFICIASFPKTLVLFSWAECTGIYRDLDHQLWSTRF